MLDDLVLFIDGEAIVLDKPAGLPVDPPRDGSPSIVGRADELRFTFQREPTSVHRLDRDTSGCLLLARNPKAHARFQQAFEQGRVTKRYLAILDGIPAGESGEIDLPLAKVSTAETGWRMVGDAKGKPARTNWRVLRTVGDRALVALFPETGRTHQIRVHMAEGLGCPVAGDPVYGRGGRHGMLLHAIGLMVPRDNKPAIDVTAPWPRSFVAAGFEEA